MAGWALRAGAEMEALWIFSEELDLKALAGSDLDPLVRLRYMAKGANSQEVVILDNERITLEQLSERTRVDGKPGIRLEPQGNVRVSKRAGSSRPTGKAARKAAGWADDSDLLWLCPELGRRRIRAEVRARLKEWFRPTAACAPGSMRSGSDMPRAAPPGAPGRLLSTAELGG